MVPYRLVENFTETDNRLTLHVPKFKNRILTRLVASGRKSPTINVKLDETGTLVWKQINGKSTVQEICDALRTNEGGNELSALEERTAQYIQMLYKHRIIKFKEEYYVK